MINNYKMLIGTVLFLKDDLGVTEWKDVFDLIIYINHLLLKEREEGVKRDTTVED